MLYLPSSLLHILHLFILLLVLVKPNHTHSEAPAGRDLVIFSYSHQSQKENMETLQMCPHIITG